MSATNVKMTRKYAFRKSRAAIRRYIPTI